MIKLGKTLKHETQNQLEAFLKDNLYVFAQNHVDMVGIVPKVMYHKLNIHPNFKLVFHMKNTRCKKVSRSKRRSGLPKSKQFYIGVIFSGLACKPNARVETKWKFADMCRFHKSK